MQIRVSRMTPGQAAFRAARGTGSFDGDPEWDEMSDWYKSVWESIADGVIDEHDSPAEFVALRSQVDYFRELVAQILGELDGDPVWGGRARDWRERAGLEQP
jgi:hypothetical protein